MLNARSHGAIFFTGASASVKGYPQSAAFAMGKFALRGLAQSMISIVAGRFPEMAFDFALAHREKVDERVDATSRSQYYPGLAGGSGKVETIAKIQNYADTYLDKGSRRSADTAIASIKNRIKVREEQLPAIDAWLAKHGGGKAGGGKKTAQR